jgi:hypothetical protein
VAPPSTYTIPVVAVGMVRVGQPAATSLGQPPSPPGSMGPPLPPRPPPCPLLPASTAGLAAAAAAGCREGHREAGGGSRERAPPHSRVPRDKCAAHGIMNAGRPRTSLVAARIGEPFRSVSTAPAMQAIALSVLVAHLGPIGLYVHWPVQTVVGPLLRDGSGALIFRVTRQGSTVGNLPGGKWLLTSASSKTEVAEVTPLALFELLP